MPELTLIHWTTALLLVVTSVVAGMVRGFTGFGGPAIMVLVLSQFYHPASVVVTVMLIDFLANVQLFAGAVRQVRWRAVLPLVIASAITLPLGLHVLLSHDPTLVKRGIALVVGVAACVMLTGWRYRREPGGLLTVAVGAFGGLIVGATFVALPVMIFLFSGPAPVARARANGLTWGLCMSLIFIGVFTWRGLLHLSALWQSALLALVYLGSAYAGSRLFNRSSEPLVRRVVLGSLLTLSVIGLVT